MRTLLIAGLGTVLAIVGAADAQRMVQRGPGASYPMLARGGGAGGRPGMSYQPGSGYQPGRPVYRAGQPRYYPGRPGFAPVQGGSRWQNRDGRWIGGWNAPGGWSGYRRPFVGWALPSYWVQPGFGIGDWAGYGMAQPPYGYSWSRYYDDAVLIDARGSVYDTVGGIYWYGRDGTVKDGYGYDDGDRDDGRGGGYWVSPNGTTTVTTSGGYAGAGSTTTVVVQSAPTVMTTTTEIIEDDVTYTRRAPVKVVKRRWRPTKTICRC